MNMEIKYTIKSNGAEGNLVIDIPGYGKGERHDVSITQGRYVDQNSNSEFLNQKWEVFQLFVNKDQLNDLIFILGQAKKEYGLPD